VRLAPIHAVVLDGRDPTVRHPATTYRSVAEAFKHAEYAYAATSFRRPSSIWQILRGFAFAALVMLALIGLKTACF
jgi:hypothetical protein